MFDVISTLVAFVWRYCLAAGRARTLVVLSGTAAGVAAAANVALIALVSAGVSRDAAARRPLFWYFVGACLGLAAARLAGQWLIAGLTHRAILDLRVALSRRIVAAPLRMLEELESPSLLATLTDDVTSITRAVADLPLLAMHATLVLGALGYMAYLSPWLFAGVIGMMVVGVTAYLVPLLRGVRHAERARGSLDALYTEFRAVIEGNKELKLHGSRRTAFLENHLRVAAAEVRDHGLRADRIYVGTATLGHTLFFVLLGGLLFVPVAGTGGSREVLTGYALAVLCLMTPLEMLLNSVPTLSRAAVAIRKAERLGSLLASGAEAQVPADVGLTLALPARWNTIELAGVTHSYRREGEDTTFTLGPCTLTLARGEVVFVSGGNGSGKTTLAKLLVGLYAPAAGEVRVDGVRVNDHNRQRYRECFSVVFSDFFLFDQLLGVDWRRLDSHPVLSLADLQLDRQVKVVDGRFTTTALSRGQRKRLALLVACLEDRSIYVFDEWAADQDPVFKRVFYGVVLPRLKTLGKTVVAITHDDAYYGVADRLIELRDGRIHYSGLPPERLELSVVPSGAAP